MNWSGGFGDEQWTDKEVQILNKEKKITLLASQKSDCTGYQIESLFFFFQDLVAEIIQ